MSQPRNALRRAGTCAAALALIGSTVTVLAPSVAADPATRLVATDGTDSGDCTASACATIGYAVDQADSGDTIHVARGTYSESVHIRKSLTIVGAGTSGAEDTIVSGSTDSGDPSIFIDGIDSDTPPVVTVTNLDVSGNADDDGIEVDDATLHLSDSVVSNNDRDGLDVNGASTATVGGSTIHGNGNAGVILDSTEQAPGSPSLTVSNSVASGNGDGGVVIEAGNALIEGTTLDKNLGAGVVADGEGTHATINTSTISGTAPSGRGDEGEFGGGVLVFPGGTADISTSTIAGNTGQGVYSNGGTVTITDSTIAGTKSGSSGDLASGGVVADAMVPELRAAVRVRAADAEQEGPGVSVIGTIIAAQAKGVPDCAGDITDNGHNLSSDADNSCNFSAADHDVTKRDPLLGALGDNGGPTFTMMLGTGSPARDAIPSTEGTTCNNDFPTDQRGVDRPLGPGCDIGAVEAPAVAPPPVTCPPLVIDTTTLPDGTVGTAYSVQLKASGGCDNLYSWSLPSEPPAGGFPPAGSQSTAPAGGQSAAARPADAQPVFTPTLHRSPVAAPSSQSAATDTPVTSPAGNATPPGLTLDANGVLSGSPTQAGTYTFTVSVNDPVLATLVLHVAAAAAGSPSSSATTPAPASTSRGVGGVSTTAGPTATQSAGGSLANTGASVGPQVRLALTLLVAGGALVLAGTRRRRRPRQH